MTRQVRYIVLAIALYMVCWAMPALAQVCDFTGQRQSTALTAAQFFGQRIGAVALGGQCDESLKTCQAYYDFSNCTEVRFPVALSGTANRLFVTFNTMSACPRECAWVDSFLQVGVLYPPNPQIAPFVDLVRNASARWGVYHGRPATQLKCCESLPGRMPAPEQYALFDAIDAKEDLLFEQTKMAWHSVFQPSYRQTGDGPPIPFIDMTLGDGQPDVTTWTLRSFLYQALATCADCSAKLMMTRFQETQTTDTIGQPSVPLLQAFNVMNYPQVHLVSRAPYAEGVYDRTVDIHLVR